MSMHIDCFDDDEDKLVLNENDDIEAVLNDNDDIEVVLNDNDDIEVVLDDSEGIEVVLNDSNDIEVVLDSSAITWSEINGDLRKNKAIIEFLNNLPMLPDIPVEGEYILKAVEGNEFWEEDNLATRDELALAKEELQANIDTKQDRGDYATNETLNATKEELQAEIDTKQDKGDYALKSEIPSITHLATKEEVELADKALTEAVAKLDADKQDKGDYAVKSDLIPLATKEELSSASHALQNKIDEKQDRGDYATNETLNATKEELQAEIDTKQDKGDYALKSEIPDVTPYATKTELTEGLNTKQDKGDYVTKTQYDQTNESFQNALNSKQDAGDYVTNTELESKGYLTSYTEIDPIYTADKPNLALKSELPDLAPYATKEELNSGLAGKQEAGDYALKSEIPTNNNQLENGAGYVTADYHDSTKQDVIDDLDEIRSGAELGATALQSYTEIDPIYTADKPNIATKDELTEGLDTKQDVIEDLETIREGASKGATALQSVPDEYITETELESKGYLTSYTETDPIYTADKPNLALKSELPTKVSSLINDANYQTAAEVAQMIASIPQFEVKIVDELPLQGQKMILYLVPKTSAGGDNIYDEYIWLESTPSFELIGTTTVDLSNYYTKEEINQSLNNKQNVINDLDTIREGASLGATALQSVPSEYITETELNNKGYLTEHQDISNLATKEELTTGLSDKQDIISDLETIREGASKGSTALQSVPSEYITETELESKGYLTSYTEIDPIYTADKPNIATKDELTEGLNTKQDIISDLETIRDGASKGSTALQKETDPIYTADKPNLALKSEIPTKTSQLTNDSDYITSKYHDSTKQDVISDLETIREGASKGATALQSVPSEYITETELESKGYLTEHQDISNLATKEEVNSKQDKLVSGTNIKTINGEPILGSGNIEVEAGTQYAMVVVDHTV